MMRRFYALLTLLIVLLIPIGAWAEDLKADDTFVVDGVTYSVIGTNPREVQVGTGHFAATALADDKTAGIIEIPSSVIGPDGNSYSVKIIGAFAFSECTNLTSITLPSSIVEIEYYAFRACLQLTSITIPNSVEIIGNGAFEDCISLSSVAFPSSLNTLGSYVFRSCLSLESFTIPSTVLSIGSNVFAVTKWYDNLPDGMIYKDNIFFGYKGNQPEGGLEIADETRVLAGAALQSCSNLTSVKLPSSLKTIGFYALKSLPGVSSITIPNSVTSIEEEAFADNHFNEIISLMEEPCKLGWKPFKYEGSDAEEYQNHLILYVPADTKAKYEATDGWKEFKNIVEMTPYDVLDDNTVAAHFLEPDEEGKLEIPETVEIDGKTYTVTEIAANAFKDNKDLTEVTIPGTVTKIGDGAFAGCENLRAIYVFAPEPISLTAAEARSIVTRAAENVPSQFEGIDFDACTLYVPIGSEQKYRDAEGWKLFVNIVGVEYPSGISTIRTEQKANEAVYNLSGQRLAAPRRGLNIIGGRKVVMK